MNFLSSIKTDLIDKRLWPALLALLVALAAIVLILGRTHASPAPAPVASLPTASLPPGLGVGPGISAAPVDPNLAVSEMTNGSRYQRQGGAHDPFTALPAPPVKKVAAPRTSAPAAAAKPLAVRAVAASTSAAVAAGRSVAGGSGGASAPVSGAVTGAPGAGGPSPATPGAPGAGGPSPATPGGTTSSAPTSAPSAPPPTLVPPRSPLGSAYHVDFRFGSVPIGGSSATHAQGDTALEFLSVPIAQLPNFKNPARMLALPNAKNPLLVYLGVRPDGRTLSFALLHQAILHGNAVCRPSLVHCDLIDLKVGQAVTLDYISPTLGIVRYELAVTSSTKGSASAASVAAGYDVSESKVGRALLTAQLPSALAAFRFDVRRGVLIASPSPSPSLPPAASPWLLLSSLARPTGAALRP